MKTKEKKKIGQWLREQYANLQRIVICKFNITCQICIKVLVGCDDDDDVVVSLQNNGPDDEISFWIVSAFNF